MKKSRQPAILDQRRRGSNCEFPGSKLGQTSGDLRHTERLATVASFRTWRGSRASVAQGPKSDIHCLGEGVLHPSYVSMTAPTPSMNIPAGAYRTVGVIPCRTSAPASTSSLPGLSSIDPGGWQCSRRKEGKSPTSGCTPPSSNRDYWARPSPFFGVRQP